MAFSLFDRGKLSIVVIVEIVEISFLHCYQRFRIKFLVFASEEEENDN